MGVEGEDTPGCWGRAEFRRSRSDMGWYSTRSLAGPAPAPSRDIEDSVRSRPPSYRGGGDLGSIDPTGGGDRLRFGWGAPGEFAREGEDRPGELWTEGTGAGSRIPVDGLTEVGR